jgi:hypothetical protein
MGESGLYVPGQQRLEVIGAGSLRKLGKEAREVGMRLDAVRLGRSCRAPDYAE